MSEQNKKNNKTENKAKKENVGKRTATPMEDVLGKLKEKKEK
jgi:hypothetical protein